MKGKLWGPGFMREGAYTEEPALGSKFVFVSESGEVISTEMVKRMVEGPEDIVLTDSLGNDYWFEKKL